MREAVRSWILCVPTAFPKRQLNVGKCSTMCESVSERLSGIVVMNDYCLSNWYLLVADHLPWILIIKCRAIIQNIAH